MMKDLAIDRSVMLFTWSFNARDPFGLRNGLKGRVFIHLYDSFAQKGSIIRLSISLPIQGSQHVIHMRFFELTEEEGGSSVQLS
jgi:hypothetical protein